MAKAFKKGDRVVATDQAWRGRGVLIGPEFSDDVPQAVAAIRPLVSCHRVAPTFSPMERQPWWEMGHDGECVASDVLEESIGGSDEADALDLHFEERERVRAAAEGGG